MLGAGRPSAWQGNSTVLPVRTSVESGVRMKNGARLLPGWFAVELVRDGLLLLADGMTVSRASASRVATWFDTVQRYRPSSLSWTLSESELIRWPSWRPESTAPHL